jgi:hypothetical protein
VQSALPSAPAELGAHTPMMQQYLHEGETQLSQKTCTETYAETRGGVVGAMP